MKIKYVDWRSISIPFLTYYRGGVSLPSGDNILKVTDEEARSLLKTKNGHIPCWEEVKERPKREEIKQEVTEDGSRE